MPQPTTPFPNELLDRWLPRLRDTEWRVLCVVVRQTLGWQSSEGRKTRDWLSQSQLVRRTGRRSAAVSQAIDRLVRLRLVFVTTEGQAPLITPNERRRYRGRLFFSLAESLHGIQTKSEVRKANTTKETDTKRKQQDRAEAVHLQMGWVKAAAVNKKKSGPPRGSA